MCTDKVYEMNSQNNEIIRKMYNKTSEKYHVPDRRDFEVILNYYYSVVSEEYEISIADPKQSEFLSEMNWSLEDILMNKFSKEFHYTNDFEQLEEQLLYSASAKSNYLKIETLSESEKIPCELQKTITQIRMPGWVFFLKDDSNLKKTKCGKWMYFFSDKYWAKKMCLKAVDENAVCEAKYTDDKTGVACFYLNIDDYEQHKKVIQFFLENNLVRKTKTGRYTNIAFKLDRQTSAKKYGNEFDGIVHLSDFIDLETGKYRGE